MTHQPGTPEQRSAAGSAPEPAPSGGETPAGEGGEGRPDSRRVWLDRTDALFGDVPGSGQQRRYGAAPPPPAPQAPPSSHRLASSVQWPSIDASTTGLERPDWDQWRRYQDQSSRSSAASAPQSEHEARVGPPYSPSAVAPSGATARRSAGAVKRLGGPGWVPVVVMAGVMVMSFGVRPYGAGYDGHHPYGGPGAYGMNQLGDTSGSGIGQASTVKPIGADQLTAPVDPRTVRLELVAASGTTATVSYGADGHAQRAEHIALPWAVEAPITADNNAISVTGAQEGVSTSGGKAALTCRVYLDDVLVNEQRSRGMTACTTKLDAFRSGRPGQGAALSSVTQVEAASTVMPALPTAGASVTFEAYSSQTGDALDVDFGPLGRRAGQHREHQPAPSAWQAPTTKDVGQLTMRVRHDGPPTASSTLMCRILVDRVVVAQTLNAGEVDCTAVVGDVVGA